MSLIQYFKSKGPSGFGYASTAEDVTQGLSLAGKTILITGCNSGLGLESMRVLHMRGARVVGTARKLDKAREACSTLSGQTIALECELANPASVRACAAAIADQGISLDAIICNAGIMALPKLQLAHGYELQFFTNHIGHFILVNALTAQLTDTARVVMVSSLAHTQAKKGGIDFENLDCGKSYSPWREYGQSKFANILFAKELARRFTGTGRTANAVHPGIISTNLARNSVSGQLFYTVLGPIICKTIPQGAATQVYAATNPALAQVSGQYLVDSNLATPRADTEDASTAKRLWDLSEDIAGQIK